MALGKNKQRQLSIIFDEYAIRFLEVTTKKDIIITIHHSSIIKNTVLKDGQLNKDEWKRLLKKHLKENKIKAKIVSIALPSSAVIFRQQIMPDLPTKDLKLIIQYELGNSIHLPFNNPIFDIVRIESGTQLLTEDGQAAIQIALVAAPGNVIYPLLDVLQENRLKTKSIDIPALSLYRLFSSTYPSLRNEVVLLSFISQNGFDLHILDNGAISFTRHIPLEIINFDEAKDQENMQHSFLSFASDYAYEIERAINFFQYTLNNRGKKISYCLISSDIDFSTDFYTYLEERIGLNVKSLIYSSETITDKDKYRGYEIGIGVLLRGLEENNQVNLLPHLPKYKKYQLQVAMITGMLVLISGGFLGMAYLDNEQILEVKNEELKQISAEREAKQGLLNENKENSALMSSYLEAYTVLAEGHINFVPFLDDISSQLPSNGYIQSIKWEEGSFNVIGELPNLDMVGQYVQLLSQLDWIAKVEVTNIQDKSTKLPINDNGNESVLFTMDIYLNNDQFYLKGVDKNE